MKILFFGTSRFGLPALEKLSQAGYEIVGVVTQPDRPAGRKQQPLPSPVKQWAHARGFKVFQPERLKIGNWKLEIPFADIYIVASYGLIIPQEILDTPRLGALNLHPSLLPKYRGSSPIQAAILNGNTETGVTIIKMDKEVDHGPILGNSKFQIPNAKMTYTALHNQLADQAARLLIDILPKYVSGEIKPQAQDDGRATYTKIIQKKDAQIDWAQEADPIDRLVRAYEEWPVAWTTLDGERLKIFKTRVSGSSSADGRPGQILDSPGRILVACGKSQKPGTLEIVELQIAGGKKMGAENFLRGAPGLAGKIFV